VKKLVLAALFGLFALSMFAGGTAAAAPAEGVRCTGSNSVWDDTDVVHLTKEGAGTLVLSWTVGGQTTLNCGAHSPLNGQVARIEERVRADVMANGAVQGQAHVRLAVANKHQLFNGRFVGTATVGSASLDVTGNVYAGETDGADFLAIRQHGTVNRATQQWTNIYIDDIIIGLRR